MTDERTLLRAVGWFLLLAVLVVGPRARAADYGLFIEVETEEDLLDLLSNGEIDDSTFETLAELLNEGVDLNTADRDELYSLPNLTYADADAILAYRQEGGAIKDPAALVIAGVLDEKRLLAIAAFLLVDEPTRLAYDTRGRVRYRTTYVGGDEQVPSMYLSGRVSSFQHLDVGISGVLTRSRLRDVVYDPNRDALSAREPAVQFLVPKYHVQWETKDWHLVAGTYRIGFGQRLTFDNTGWYVPKGIRVDDTIYYSQDLTRSCKESAGELPTGPCTGPDGSVYQSPDYRWTDRLRGAAVGLKHLALGDGWLQAYAFASYQTHPIYQYEIYNPDRCPDPRDDEDPLCSAPYVFRRQDDLLAPTTRFSYYSLPDMFNELLAGGNATYYFSRRAHIGVTGYGADISWLVQGMKLDFQEWSRWPFGGPFGALGLDAAWGADWADLFFEFARSFDGQPEGGGFAALLRATGTWKKQEFEAAIRYYDKDFANPYARPISAADEYDGLRSRDEAGMRLRYSGTLEDLQLRATADFWMQPSVEAPKTILSVRADYDLETWFRPGLWFEYQDKDLSYTARGNCFETSFDTVEGEPEPCAGEKLKTGVQLQFKPLSSLTLSAKYQHAFVDDSNDRYQDSFRQDATGWLIVMFKPTAAIRIRARLRYLYQGVGHNDYLEQSIWGYLEGAYWVERLFRVKLRYEVYAWLDDRASTGERNPNPAHWLRLELEARF